MVGKHRAFFEAAGVFALLGLLALLAYGGGLNGPFVFDDRFAVAGNHWLTFSHIPRFFRSFVHDSSLTFPGYRPFLMATLAVDREFFGPGPLAFRLHNLVLLCLLGTVVFVLVRRIFERHTSFPAATAAFLASVAFVLHPVQTNLIGLVWKRSDLLAGIGLFGGLLCFQTWVEAGRGRRGSLLLGHVLCLIALLSKETAFVAAAVLGLADFVLWRRVRPFRSRALAVYFPVIAITLAVAWIRFCVGPEALAASGYRGDAFLPADMLLDRKTYFLTQFAAVPEYLRVALVPVGLRIFHFIPPVRLLSDGRLWIGGGLLLSWCVLGALCLRRHRPAAFALWLAPLLFAPSSGFVPLQMSFDEDRLSLPLVPLGLLGAYGLVGVLSYARSQGFTRVAYALAGFVASLFFLYVSADRQRMSVWKNPVRLWASNVEEQPEDPRPWLGLGEALEASGHPADAAAAYREALRRSPEYGMGYFLLAQSLRNAGRSREALEPAQKARALGVIPPRTLSRMPDPPP